MKKRAPFVHLTARAAAPPRRLVAGRGDLPDLPAQLPGQQRRRRRRPARHHAPAGICRAARRRRDLDLAVLQSPMKDYGYDVADYCAVDPLFGTLADFDALLAEAHRLGLKVMMDFVPSHTSDQHAWFLESRQSRDNPKADWYVWADAKPDGTPPNNWLAVFGGSAWEWEPRRGQYYLHNFLKEQPDLNFHNPQVIEALLGQARVLARARRRRLSAATRSTSASTTRSCATTRPRRQRRAAGGSAPGSPFAMQRPALQQGAAGADRAVPQAAARADRALRRQGAAGRDQRRRRALRAGRVHQWRRPRHRLQLRPAELPRHAQGHPRRRRAAGEDDGRRLGLLVVQQPRRPPRRHPLGRRRRARGPAPAWCRVLLGSLRGTVCLYQGEELGLEEAELAFEQLKDPFGIAFWPTLQGPRRLPHADALGESAHRSRLHHRRALAADPREPPPPRRRRAGRRPALRAQHHPRLPQLAPRAPAAQDRPDQVRARGRRRAGVRARSNNDRLLCLFNLGGTDQTFRASALPLDAGFNSEGVAFKGRKVILPPWGYAFAHLE